jgi:hypothetical protein
MELNSPRSLKFRAVNLFIASEKGALGGQARAMSAPVGSRPWGVYLSTASWEFAAKPCDQFFSKDHRRAKKVWPDLAALHEGMTMGILLRVRRNSSGGSNLKRKLYGGRETLSPVSIEEECAVLAKMFANPIKREPSAARQADKVLARWYGP